MKIALLTSGGVAPCLSAAIGKLVEIYFDKYPNIEIIGYLNGYKGLLLGKSIIFPKSIKSRIKDLYELGGSPLGNSRVKLTNIEDCIKNGIWINNARSILGLFTPCFTQGTIWVIIQGRKGGSK